VVRSDRLELIEDLLTELARDAHVIIRLTRNWLHYGALLHVTLCALIAAIEGLIMSKPAGA
jgi:hypothetical protein